MKTNRSAFTLVELLTVIAIIALIAAILFPVFSSAREKARQASCASNLRQLGLAFLQYEQDYDEAVPLVNYQTCTAAYTCGAMTGGGWPPEVYPYVGAKGVYVCPSDPTPATTLSYIANAAVLSQNDVVLSLNGVQFIQISKFTAPANTVTLMESVCAAGYIPASVASLTDTTRVSNDSILGNGAAGDRISLDTGVFPSRYASAGCGPWWLDTVDSTGCYPHAYNTLTGRHNGGSNYLLADGHTKYLMASHVSAGTIPLGGANCNQDESDGLNGGCSKGVGIGSSINPACTTSPSPPANKVNCAAGTAGLLPDGSVPAATWSIL